MTSKSLFRLLPLLAAAVALLTFSACSEPSFKIEGEIEGADNVNIELAKSDFHGHWIVVDSTHTGSSGRFSLSQPAPAAPEIFRLTYNGKHIYFPIDSVETLNVKTSAAAFGSDFTLTGSHQAEKFAEFEKSFMKLSPSTPADSLQAFKRRVYTDYIAANPASILSYYVLTKTLGNRFLFDPENRSDIKYYAAVATAFRQYRPDDPHTLLLEQTTLSSRRRHNSEDGRKRVVNAEEIRLIDITLPDTKGNNVSLSSVVGHGNPGVLVFALMNLPESPSFNRDLNEIRLHNPGLAIYHVSVDPDTHAWREAADNLPWTNVIDPSGNSSSALIDYNVTDLPAFFIFNRQGELVDRAATLSELSSRLRSL